MQKKKCQHIKTLDEIADKLHKQFLKEIRLTATERRRINEIVKELNARGESDF